MRSIARLRYRIEVELVWPKDGLGILRTQLPMTAPGEQKVRLARQKKAIQTIHDAIFPEDTDG